MTTALTTEATSDSPAGSPAGSSAASSADSSPGCEKRRSLGIKCADARAISSLSIDDLEAQICELAAHIAAAEARFVALIAEYDEREGWGRWECSSCAHWLEWKCAIGPGAARERVRVGRALRDLPVTYTAFAHGRLSYSQVRAITRVATPRNEAELVDLASLMTAAQLEDAIRMMRGAISGDEEEARSEARSLYWYYDDDGCLVFKIKVTPEAGSLVISMLQAVVAEIEADLANAGDASSGVPAGTSAAHEPTKVQLRADALIRVAEAALERFDLPTSARDQRHVVIHVDASVLAGGQGKAYIEGGPSISAQAVEKITCDSTITAIYERSGAEVLAMGRRSRVATERQRRALVIRDTHCRYPGCRNRRFLKIHHLWHWSKGGPTDMWNLIQLCSFHHDAIHDRGVTLLKRSDGSIVARTPAGRLLKPAEQLNAVADDALTIEEQNRMRGLEINSETPTPKWEGTTRRESREALLALVS